MGEEVTAREFVSYVLESSDLNKQFQEYKEKRGHWFSEEGFASIIEERSGSRRVFLP